MLQLPLLAAVAGFFDGAALACPRALVLDEAFEGIDDAHARQMLEVLGELDLDFMMASYKLRPFVPTHRFALINLRRFRSQRVVVGQRSVWTGSQLVPDELRVRFSAPQLVRRGQHSGGCLMPGGRGGGRLPAMHDAPSFSRRRIAGAAAALATLALGAPAVAQADSIAYIKAGNVFLATTDGAREYQVTFDGGYSTVSQADNGRMVALRGDRIRHLERDGRVIADIATPVSTTTDPTMQFKGPFDPAISPDGTRVAYTYYWQYKTYGPGCQPPYCTLTRLYHGTGFTDPNRLTAWDEPGFKRRSGWIDASWVDNDTVLLSSPYIQPNEDTVLWSPSAVDDSGLKRWFEDHAFSGKVKDVDHVAGQVGDRERRRRRPAASASRNTVGGFYPDYPERCARRGDEDPNKLSSPTFAGDASKLFWAENTTGIHMATLPKFTAKGVCPQFTDGGKLLSRAPRTRTGARPTCRRPVPRRGSRRQPGPTNPVPTEPGPTPGARRSS